MLCGSSDGRGVWGRMDTCVHMAEALCCSPETIRTLFFNWLFSNTKWASCVVFMVKNLPAKEGDRRDAGLIPGSGRAPGGGHGNPLQYSCLENPMDRGAWWTVIHRVTKSQTWLKLLSIQAHIYKCAQYVLSL